MKIKTSKLINEKLDWAVAKCNGKGIEFDDPRDPWLVVDGIADQPLHSYTPSTDWSQAGPIIEREGINTFKYNKLDASEHDKWGAHKVVPRKAMDGVEYSAALCLDGPTPLIAAMRCYVASKLGDKVEIPEELQ